MKKLVSLAIGAAALYGMAKRNGIDSFKKLKEVLVNEFNLLTADLKHDLVS
jgi:hypothetical protein